METKYSSISADAIRALRDTTFAGGKIGNISFIRCGRRLAPGEATKLAAIIRAATGDTSEQVTFAHNPEFAEHDYLRVSTDSKAYAFVCHLKS